MKFLKIVGLIILLVITMLIAIFLSACWHFLDKKIPILPYLLHALTYPILMYFAVKSLITRGLSQSLKDYRITKFKVIPLCVLLGILLPVAVIIIYLLFVPGKLVVTSMPSTVQYIEMLADIILIGGIAAPIVEETVFRGVLMKYIEDKTNIYVAIGITSIVFAGIHLLNGWSTSTDVILLFISGIAVGILFGTATYIFNTIWASIFLHAFWNLNGLFIVTSHNQHYGIAQYILRDNSPLITGGAFGIEGSIISSVCYLLVCLILIIYSRKKRFT